MPVKFTLDNANDSTPANNEVVVDVTLQPAIECEVTATLSAPVTEPELGRHYFATVTVTNTSTVELSYVALVFGDIGGYEVRPVTAPQWDQDAGLLVSNPDWKEPYLYGSGVYLVALKPILQPGSSVDYHVRITRRTADINATVVFDVIGPCGYTGESAELEFSGDVSGSLWLLPPGGDIEAHRPSNTDVVEREVASYDGTYDDMPVQPLELVIEAEQVIPAGSWLRILNGVQHARTGTTDQIEVLQVLPLDFTEGEFNTPPELDAESLNAIPSATIPPGVETSSDIVIQTAVDIPAGVLRLPATLYGYTNTPDTVREARVVLEASIGGSVLIEGNTLRIRSAIVAETWILPLGAQLDANRPAHGNSQYTGLEGVDTEAAVEVVLDVREAIPQYTYLIIRNATGLYDSGAGILRAELVLGGTPVPLSLMGSIPAGKPDADMESTTDLVYRLDAELPVGLYTFSARVGVSGSLADSPMMDTWVELATGYTPGTPALPNTTHSSMSVRRAPPT